jgi:hypothetical protein
MGDNFKGRKPDYNLSVKVKDSPLHRRLGVGWKNANGSISIQLDPCRMTSTSRFSPPMVRASRARGRTSASRRLPARVGSSPTWSRRSGAIVVDKKKPKAFKKPAPEKPHRIELVAGVEGMALYLNGYRIAGPKPWGGGVVRNQWDVSAVDLEHASEALRRGR